MNSKSIWLVAPALTMISVAAFAGPSPSAPGCDAPKELTLNTATRQYEIDLGNCEGITAIWTRFGAPAAGFPDSTATYFGNTLPSLANDMAMEPNGHWEVRGTQPDTRFSSIQLYTIKGDAKGSVPDEKIIPNTDQYNWIQHGGRYPGAQNLHYTTKIYEHVTSDILGHDGQIDFSLTDQKLKRVILAYRIYPNLRDNGSFGAIANVKYPNMTFDQWVGQGQTDLPHLVYVVHDLNRFHYKTSGEVLGAISAASMEGAKLASAIGTSFARLVQLLPKKSDLFWSTNVSWEAWAGTRYNFQKMINEKYPSVRAAWLAAINTIPNETYGPNNSSPYYFAGFNPALNDIVVTRFKTPSSVDPDKNQVVFPSASSTYQARYWSFCLYNSIIGVGESNACTKDSDFNVDPDGFVTVVMHNSPTPPFDPFNHKYPAPVYLRFNAQNQLVLMRQTLVNTEVYPNSLNLYVQQHQNPDGTPDYQAYTNGPAINKLTGDYYPHSVYCSLSQYQKDRCMALWKAKKAEDDSVANGLADPVPF